MFMVSSSGNIVNAAPSPCGGFDVLAVIQLGDILRSSPSPPLRGRRGEAAPLLPLRLASYKLCEIPRPGRSQLLIFSMEAKSSKSTSAKNVPSGTSPQIMIPRILSRDLLSS